MNKFNTWVSKIKFKKFVTVYIIVSVIAVILSLCFLGFVFKDKLTAAYNYEQVSEKIEKNRAGINAVKPDLKSLAGKSTDIVDILILNNKNKIIYNAKSSSLAKTGKLELTKSTDREKDYLIDKSNPDIYFMLIKDDDLLLSKAIIGRDNDVEKGYRDNYFYENDFKSKTIYMLSYIVDKSSGNKIYFISNVQPVANGETYVKIVSAVAILIIMIYWVLLALWVYANALKSKLNCAVWGIITLFTNIAGLLVYMIYKQSNQTCYKCGAVQNRTNKFCTGCGTKISRTCEFCNSVVNDKDSYCKNCGTQINQKQ